MWEYRSVSEGLFASLCVMTAIGVTFTVACFAFNVRFRKMRLIRMSSPNLNILITLGGLLSYSCCVLFGLDAVLGNDLSASTVVCQVRTWLMTLSLTLIFGTMLAKSWRVYRIFHKAGTQRVVIKDEKLVAIVVILICVDVTILSLWHGLDPIKAELMPAGFWKPDVPGLSNWTAVVVVGCSCSNISVWLTVLFLYKAALLTAGVYLSWATRNVVLPPMNEATFTILGTFTTTILCTIATALSVVLGANPDAAGACLAIAVWLSTTACLLLVFVPKMKLVLTHKDTQVASLSMKLSSISSRSLPSTESIDQLHQEMCRLVSENQRLKKSLTEKDSTIQSLQAHLNSAQTKLEQLAEEAEVKNDSGLDFELSSADCSQSGETNERTIHVQPQSENTTTSQATITVISETTDPKSCKHQVQRSESVHSYQPLQNKGGDFEPGSLLINKGSTRSRIAALRESIAEDLQHAHSFSTNLRESICKDLDQLSFHEVSQCSAALNGLLSVGSRKGLAGSIAESYSFGPDGDDWSYIHQFLQTQLPNIPTHNDTNITSKPTRNSTSEIPDCNFVLDGDQKYPEFQVREQYRQKRCKSQRRSREFSRGPGLKYITAPRKTKPHDDVYVIQNPNMKHFITSVVQKQCVQTADGTVFLEVLDSFV